jgi:hypothetical protein
LFAPPICSKGANVVWCQALQLSATLEIVDVELIVYIALVHGHQAIVAYHQYGVQLCPLVFRNEVFAEILDMNWAQP